jgi:hypothetical protein
MLKKRSTVVKLEFKRSGGFAPITNASGSVTFGDNDAHVSANDGNYQRALAPSEAEALRAAADPSNLSKAATPPTNRALRDGFQYDFVITTKDGARHNLTINTAGPTDLNQLSPNAAQLLKWAADESQAILKHRSAAR